MTQLESSQSTRGLPAFGLTRTVETHTGQQGAGPCQGRSLHFSHRGARPGTVEATEEPD